MSEARPRVWVSQPLFGDVIGRLREHFDVIETTAIGKHAQDEIAAMLASCDGALVTLNDRIGGAEVAGAPRLRAIANVGVGYNNLDVPALTQAGILATNTPDVLTETTADFGFALMMAAARRITEAERWLREASGGSGVSRRCSAATCTARRSASSAWGASGRASPAARRASACACCTTTGQGCRPMSKPPALRST